MAVAYRSHNNTGFTSKDGAAWTVTITKPTGLTAGDYMVAVVFAVDQTGTVQSVSGWTLLGSVQAQSNKTIAVYGKVADSADASATNFSFTVFTGTGVANSYIAGTLIACSGTQPISEAAFFDAGTDTDNSSATQVYTGGITPPVADNVLVMATLASGVVTTVSGYAITTNDPTWTERHDTNVNDTNDYTLGVATAPRSQITATGDFQVTYGTGTPPSIGVLVAVIEQQNASVSPAVVEATTEVQAPTVSAGANVSPSVVEATANVIAPTVSAGNAKWNNADKSAASSFTNTDKS